MDRRSFSCALAAGYFALALTPLQSQEAKQEWGNLSATFVYDGEPPERQELVVDKEKKDAFTLPLLDESLVVDAESKGVGNVVVWLRAAKDAPPQVHPSYEESLKKPQEVLIQNGRFEPHITTVRVGQQYIIRNGDKVGHAAKADFFLNRFGCDLLIPGGTSQASFNKSEGRPVVLADVYYIPTWQSPISKANCRSRICRWATTRLCSFMNFRALFARPNETVKSKSSNTAGSLSTLSQVTTISVSSTSSRRKSGFLR
jgi:hypothetical protein